jgi:hypothetical protein
MSAIETLIKEFKLKYIKHKGKIYIERNDVKYKLHVKPSKSIIFMDKERINTIYKENNEDYEDEDIMDNQEIIMYFNTEAY